MKKLSIIVPAYNESKTIRTLVERIFEVKFPLDFEVVIIDDHSHDRTFRIARVLAEHDLTDRIRILRNDKNRGKGYCLARGFREATGDVVVVQDADFEYDPHEIPTLLTPLLEGRSDVVYGSRFLGSRRPEGMALPNLIANWFLTFLTNVLYQSHLSDMETCYKIIRREILDTIELSARRFDFEPEITSKLLKKKVQITELPITYHGRTASEGKKIKAIDFFIALRVLIVERLKP